MRLGAFVLTIARVPGDALVALLPGSLSPDQLCCFAILVEGTTPSAMNLVLICIMAGVDPGPCARALFYQYLTSIFTLTMWISIVMHACAVDFRRGFTSTAFPRRVADELHGPRVVNLCT